MKTTVSVKKLRYRRDFRQRLRSINSNIFLALFFASILISLSSLAALLIVVLVDGLPQLNWSFLTSYDSSIPSQAGILASLVGTVFVVGITAILTAPIGVSSAIFLEEIAPDNWFTNVIRLNISNLAGVPSIIYGLLGFAIFVEIILGGQRGVIAGSLTLMLLILPIVIITSQEAIRAIPGSHRQAAYALGATRWQVIKTVVLPQAMGGIASGTILAYSRAIGEAAPILVISSIITITFLPASLSDSFTILPLQIFDWTRRPQQEFQDLASSAIIVLLLILIVMNACAIWIRSRSKQHRD